MEVMTVKFEDAFGLEIEKAMKQHHYATKAEFIREAIREKLIQLDKQTRLMKLYDIYGKGKGKHHITDEDVRKARDKAVREIAKEMGVALD